MKRGEIWTVSSSGHAGNPRPALILQSDEFEATASVTIGVFTSDTTEAPLFRPVIDPANSNGLRTTSRLMADKITTGARERLGHRVGALGADDMRRVEQAILVFLGIA